MNLQFSAEIEITENKDDGLCIGCSEKILRVILRHLNSQGFSCSKPNIAIPGTRQIHNYMEFSVNGQNFNKIRDSIIDFLNKNNINFTEDQSSSEDESNSIFNLVNVSVFDK